MIKHSKSGKVREMFDYSDNDDYMIILTTNRVSAFDHILPTPIPGKGRSLVKISTFWMNMMEDIIPNHLGTFLPPGPTAFEWFNLPYCVPEQFQVVRKLKPLPIEAIVRGYIIGSGWKDYMRTGKICGRTLPKDLKLAEKLPQPLFTPSSKANIGDHDENITYSKMVEILDDAVLTNKVRDYSIKIYNRAAKYALERGIIIADTKFEFGLDDEGELYLIDEVLTPDSSRFWDSEKYMVGINPPSFDKQIIRNWLENFWNMEGTPPTLPQELVKDTSEKYQEVVRRLLS